MIKKSAKAILFGCLILGCSLVAKDPEGGTTFRFIGIGDSFMDLKMEVGSGDFIDLEVFEGSFSQAYSSSSGGSVNLFREERVVDETGEERLVDVPVARIKKTTGTNKFLIFLARSKNSEAPFPLTGISVEDSYEDYPAETARVFNLSPYKVAAKIESDVKEITRGGYQVYPFPSGNRICVLQVAYEDKAGWQEGFTIRRPSRPNLRCLIIVSESEFPGSLSPISANFLYEAVPVPRE